MYLGPVPACSTSCCLSLVAGLGQAFGARPTRRVIQSLVQKKDLPNAIALNSIQFNLARGVRAAARRRDVAAFGRRASSRSTGVVPCGSGGAWILACLVDEHQAVKQTIPNTMLQELKVGLSYAKGTAGDRRVKILAALTTFSG